LLAQLAAENFRNLEPLTWEPGPGSHLLLGDNGSGKTSLLEAIYLLATSRSFRTANLADCSRAGTTRFSLRAEVENAARFSLAVDWSTRSRRRSLNGRAAPLAEHVAVLPVLAWTVAETELLTGAPALRRRFLDRGLVVARPAALEVLKNYSEALQHKRRLLQDGAVGLEVWNELIAQHGAAVIGLRRDYLARLQQAFSAVLESSGSRFSGAVLVYRPSPLEGLAGSEALLARLQRSVGTERDRKLPLLGPQRDDLVLQWREREIRTTASAGERKGLGLALLAAQASILCEDGRTPLVLLDDADTELDRGALARAWSTFVHLPQMIASTNRPEVFEDLPLGRRWRLDRGVLSGPPEAA
jgi:DNA replication and repair protein RecF